MDNNPEDARVCLSFSSYSSNRVAEIAARVAEKSDEAARNEDNNGGDDDFEFSFVLEDKEVLAEECFYGGQIGPTFPVFNRDLLVNNDGELSTSGENKLLESSVAIPLGKLFIEEDQKRDDPPSCSSSEADESENIPAGTHRVWLPKMAEMPLPNRCRKSKSTGSSSKRWKFFDLLRRSNSDGKDCYVFLTPKHREDKSEKLNQKASKGKGVRSASGPAPGSPSAHEAHYLRNRATKEGDKKKSYLPYRQGLLGFFANVNSLTVGTLPQF